MAVSRRKLSTRMWALMVGALLVVTSGANAETAQYLYDPLGRLIRATLNDGSIVVYDYDAAGNRTRVVHSDGSHFNATIQITGTGPVNLRTLADQAGYTGATGATITFQLGSAITITGSATYSGNGGHAIDTGLWPSASYSIALTLQVSGKAYGGGGGGGMGAGLSGPSAGKLGGDALYCRENLTVVVNSGGQLKAGGGGAGGGGGWAHEITIEGFPVWVYHNGGGGGGFPNGAGGPAGTVDPEYPMGDGASPGSAGTTSGGGAGGAGDAAGTGRTTGAGGTGGAAGAAGGSGVAATGSETAIWVKLYPSTGGQPGYAIRKNGKTVNVTNNGTIVGTIG